MSKKYSNGDNLRNKAIDYLASFGRNDIEKNNIKTKFKNISGKTGKYNVPAELFLKRVHRCSRALIPYRVVIANKLTKDILNSFENGITVEFVNNDYFDEHSDELTDWLKKRLGSDENVSSIITIKSEGDSSSNIQREAYQKLINEFGGQEEVNKNLIKKNPKYKGSKKNHVWEGFIYYSIKGGQQDTHQSHTEKLTIFNPAVEYASSTVSLHIDYTLIYFALYSVQERPERNEIINAIAQKLEKAEYDSGNLLDYCNRHPALTLEKNKLMDPIQAKEINIIDFAKISGDDSLDITHNEPVNKEKFVYDKKMKTILSPANPMNLFWSKHLSNMMQQNFSLEEFFALQEDIVARRKKMQDKS